MRWVLGVVGALAVGSAAKADFTIDASDILFTWAQGPDGLGGTLAAQQATVVRLSLPGDPLLLLPVFFEFTATQPAQQAAAISPPGTSFFNQGQAAKFSYTYDGAPIKIDGKELDSGDILLAGSYTNGEFFGAEGRRFSLADVVQFGASYFQGYNPTGLTFSSDYLTVPEPGAGVAAGPIRLTTPLNLTPGQSAGNFTGVARFETAAQLPEPASWTLMITGFGLTGGVLRRRQAIRGYCSRQASC